MGAPVTTALRVLGLQMEETASRQCRVDTYIYILNKQSRIADNGRSSSVIYGREAKISHRMKSNCYGASEVDSL
jgi:hypothetical protein